MSDDDEIEPKCSKCKDKDKDTEWCLLNCEKARLTFKRIIDHE